LSKVRLFQFLPSTNHAREDCLNHLLFTFMDRFAKHVKKVRQMN